MESTPKRPPNPIIAILEKLSLAYPGKALTARNLQLYVEHLSDIPIYILDAAADLHIQTSSFFPRIAELRQAAKKVTGGQPFASLPPLPFDHLAACLQSLEDAFYQQGRLDSAEWQALARRFDLADRPHRAAATLAKLQRLAENVLTF